MSVNPDLERYLVKYSKFNQKDRLFPCLEEDKQLKQL